LLLAYFGSFGLPELFTIFVAALMIAWLFRRPRDDDR
jgi:hypothetical protein